MALYARVSPIRNADGRAIRAQQTGFIVWKLPPGATNVASASGAKTLSKPDQLVCRKDVTTGSLIATTKQCLTKTQWAEQARRGARRDRAAAGSQETIMHGQLTRTGNRVAEPASPTWLTKK